MIYLRQEKRKEIKIMIKYIYCCDKCKKEFVNIKGTCLYPIAIKYDDGHKEKVVKREFCQDCFEKEMDKIHKIMKGWN